MRANISRRPCSANRSLICFGRSERFNPPAYLKLLFLYALREATEGLCHAKTPSRRGAPARICLKTVRREAARQKYRNTFTGAAHSALLSDCEVFNGDSVLEPAEVVSANCPLLTIKYTSEISISAGW